MNLESVNAFFQAARHSDVQKHHAIVSHKKSMVCQCMSHQELFSSYLICLVFHRISHSPHSFGFPTATRLHPWPQAADLAPAQLEALRPNVVIDSRAACPVSGATASNGRGCPFRRPMVEGTPLLEKVRMGWGMVGMFGMFGMVSFNSL
jgi:hypothetical protein